MKNKTRNVALAVIIVAGMAAIFYVWHSYGVRPQVEANALLETQSKKQILLNGTVTAERNADLGFPLTARIVSINKNVGDTVKAGEILATEDNTDIQAQLAAARAQASGAQAVLSQLGNSLKGQKLKLKDLSGNDKKIQKAQVASVEDGIKAQSDAITAAQESVKNLQAQFSKTILRAPFDGIITRQDAEIGEVAGPTTQSFITVQSNSKNLHIEARASELDIAHIKVGDQAKITFDALGSAKTLTTTVSEIDPVATLDKGNSTYKVTLQLPSADDLITAGMHANVIFE